MLQVNSVNQKRFVTVFAFEHFFLVDFSMGHQLGKRLIHFIAHFTSIAMFESVWFHLLVRIESSIAYFAFEQKNAFAIFRDVQVKENLASSFETCTKTQRIFQYFYVGSSEQISPHFEHSWGMGLWLFTLCLSRMCFLFIRSHAYTLWQ